MGRSWGDSFGGAYGFAVDGCLGSLPPANAPPHDDDPSFISLSLSSVDSVDSGLREDEKERDFFLADEKKRD
jgi:hypothetical protein